MKTSQKESIQVLLRTSINKDRTPNKRMLQKKEKWIKQSFSKIIKDLKHRQKVLIDKEN
jgi:hypothetical protein